MSDSPATAQPPAAFPPRPRLRRNRLPPFLPQQRAGTNHHRRSLMKIQLKTAKVLSAERVLKSEKLLKLQVSLEPSSAKSSPGSARSTNRRRSSAKPS
ncbi:MAG: hypothetical protein U0361_23045 [Nitrospiraceae bacterium]